MCSVPYAVAGSPLIGIQNIVLQIVVTDIEECMEALAENLSNNLPPSRLTAYAASNGHPDKLKSASGNSNDASDGWDVPQSVIDTAVQELPVKSHISSLTSDSSQEDRAAPPQPSECSGAKSREQTETIGTISPVNTISDNQNHQKADAQLTKEVGVSSRILCRSSVVARELDWTGDVQSFHPPFDVLLVADVVSALPCTGIILRREDIICLI